MAAKKKTVLNEYGDAPKSIDDRPFYSLVLDEDQKNFVNAILNPDNTIVFCNARAGTGKTTLSIGAADILVKHGEYDGIVYIRLMEKKLKVICQDQSQRSRKCILSLHIKQ